GNGVYAFVLEGQVTFGEQQLNKRDALGVWDTDTIELTVEDTAEILLIEVPMNVN
ncbi:MAG TPA: pirin family protein, partial [Segetibacter sp.]